MNFFHQGFSLIELMIVVAIIGILAVIAIPQYQCYVTRAKISEGFQMAAAAKTAVSEYAESNTVFPNSNEEAGLSTTMSSQYVNNISVAQNGVININYSDKVGVPGKATITLTPSYEHGVITWSCGGTMPAQYRPSNCR